MLERRRWWSLANPLAFSAKRKTGMGKKAGPGMKRRKSEKTFYWCWCWVWQLPLSKNKLPVAVGQDAEAGACQSRSPKSQLCWSNEPGALRGLGAPWLRAGCLLCRQFIETGLVCFPHPSGLGLRATRSAGGAARWTTRAISGREEKLDRELWEQPRDAADKTIGVQKRELGRAGWMNFLLRD